MKNKHQPVCSSVYSVCLILQDSGSLIFSLSSLINSVFDQISALPDALMLVFTSELMGIFQHLLLNCSGRSFTDDEFSVGGASLMMSSSVGGASLMMNSSVGGASLVMNSSVGGADLPK